jgi:hypothetical protein
VRSIQRKSILALSAVMLLSLSGCTKGYHYTLTCVVRNAADGKFLEGVNAVVDTKGKKDELSYGYPVLELSDAEGRFQYKLYITMRSPDFSAPHWYLKLQKDGFRSEVVDIKPGPEPKQAGTTTPIFVVVDMHPKTPPW